MSQACWYARLERLCLFAFLVVVIAMAGCGGSHSATSSSQGQGGQQQSSQLAPSADPSGQVQTFSTSGGVDFTNEFFKDLGTNGRDCNTCHQPSNGWTISVAGVQQRFNTTGGSDDLFTGDGANCPGLDTSTIAARQKAFSVLLAHALIRVSRPIPPGAQFVLAGINDPYGCASASHLSLYRRPLPATNLKFESMVMWDDRETLPGQPIFNDLKDQAKNATLTHAAASAAPTDTQLANIVNFETALFTAQSNDSAAGDLTTGVQGGPVALSSQSFQAGENNVFGSNFDPNVMTLYSAWSSSTDPAKQSIARGEQIFNSGFMNITSVPGFNDVLGQPVKTGSCSSCHNAFNVGTIAINNPMNIGIGSAILRNPDLPVYTFNCTDGSGKSFQVTDPGVALTTGKCNDIGKFKVPVLRGLAARAPYFHDGSAPTLPDVVNFYNNRFAMGLTDQQKADLVNFLNSL